MKQQRINIKNIQAIPPAPFFLKTALDIWSLLYFHTNFEIFCSTSVKKCLWQFDRDHIESIDCIW